MIEIDLQPIIPSGFLAIGNQQALDAIVTSIVEGARAKWISLAQNTFHATMGEYINGIQPVEASVGEASVALAGAFPNYLENGGPSYDMRSVLLGPKVPVSPPGEPGKHELKDGTGFWRVIPIRHSVGVKGAGFGDPFAKAGMGTEMAASIGRDIYRRAKALSATTSEPGQKTKWGKRLPEGLAPKLAEHHKTDIYAGMVKQQKTYEKATQSQYTTFRIISTAQDDGSWMQPARTGAHLVDQVGAYIDKIAPLSFEAFASSAMGNK